MILDVLTEEGRIWEAEAVTNLLDAEVGLAQVVADVFQYLFCNPFVSGLARAFLADSCEIFGRNAELTGVEFHRMALYLT